MAVEQDEKWLHGECWRRATVQWGAYEPAEHLFESDSVWAIRAALGAQRPLLVVGEPRTGKTQLAYAAAQVLNRPVIPKTVGARTEAEELLFTFDAVARYGRRHHAGWHENVATTSACSTCTAMSGSGATIGLAAMTARHVKTPRVQPNGLFAFCAAAPGPTSPGAAAPLSASGSGLVPGPQLRFPAGRRSRVSGAQVPDEQSLRTRRRWDPAGRGEAPGGYGRISPGSPGRHRTGCFSRAAERARAEQACKLCRCAAQAVLEFRHGDG